MDMRDELIELERDFWGAAGDPEHYELRFADDGIMAFDVGVMDKPAVLAAVADSASWADFTIDDMRMTQITEDVVALTYTTVARTVGSDAVYQAVVSSVYVRRNGEWLLVLHQQTPLRRTHERTGA
jgi:hypothetical protein